MEMSYKIIQKICFTLLGIITLSSCKENIFQAEEFKSGLYFTSDSIDYTFGITPLGVTSYNLDLPVQIMGSPISQDRTYQVKVVAENTDAKEAVHFELPTTFVIKADSVKGVLPLTLLRSALGSNTFKVTLAIVETNDFMPVSERMSKIIVTYNNRIEQPNWLNWRGIKAWPTSKLGNWNPLTYVKFMELFAQMEESVPSTYNGMIKAYGGPLLPDFPGDWAWNYDFTLTKHVLIPLYRYFIVDNPQLGVTSIPKPTGFIN